MPLYLGKNYSLDLDFTDRSKIDPNFPVLHSAEDICDYFGITLNKLKFLAFYKEISTVDNYYRFHIPKKTGGMRLISSPKRDLKSIQIRIKESILDKLPVHDAATAYIRKRGIVSNAIVHTNQSFVVNIDIVDFFASISLSRVRTVFKCVGYNNGVSTILSLLCTDSEKYTQNHDGKKYYYSIGGRHLPQGAVTSPALSNLIFIKLDTQLEKLAAQFDYRYTRYSDDITFSSSHKYHLGTLIHKAKKILFNNRFKINDRKTRIMSKFKPQVVTGLAVNIKVNIVRDDIRKFRAFLHYCEKSNLRNEFTEYIFGYLSYVKSINHILYESIIRKYEWISELKHQDCIVSDSNINIRDTRYVLKFCPSNGLLLALKEKNSGTVYCVSKNDYIVVNNLETLKNTDDKKLINIVLKKYTEFRMLKQNKPQLKGQLT